MRPSFRGGGGNLDVRFFRRPRCLVEGYVFVYGGAPAPLLMCSSLTLINSLDGL